MKQENDIQEATIIKLTDNSLYTVGKFHLDFSIYHVKRLEKLHCLAKSVFFKFSFIKKASR